MEGTRILETLRACGSMLHREFRVVMTPLRPAKKWAFVVGCYNSGTELLMHMLGSHPDISSLPVEGQFLTDQLDADYSLGLPRMWVLREDLFRLTEHDEGPDALRLKREWLMRLDRDKKVLLEKSPPNAGRTRWLQKHFENAHFIAMVRDGYAVAEGIRRKADPVHRAGGWPIDLCARQWARSNEILLEDSEHLDRVLWVSYEDLAENPHVQLSRILGFLGLDEGQLGIDLERPWTVHERNEPIRNLNEDSIRRLSQTDLEIITREAGGGLERFGYPLRADLQGAGASGPE